MKIPAEVQEFLEAAVLKAFPEELVKNVKVEDVTIDTDAGEIRIVLTVSTAVDPADLAESYFGLTGKVRRSLADKGGMLRDYFPIITPMIGHGVHA